MSDLISRQNAIDALKKAFDDGDGIEVGAYWEHNKVTDTIKSLPSAVCDDCIWHVCNYNKVDWDADTVSKGVFDQVKWERDTALKTLEEHGIGFGEKVDRPKGQWMFEEQKSQNHIEKIYTCSACRNFEAWGETELYNYCPNCGAKMLGKDGDK